MKFYIWEKEIEFNENTHQLKFDDKIIDPAIRTYWDMKDMYKNKENIDNDKWLYFMFRWVYLSKYAEDKFKENNMRYDVTIIIPEIIGDEFNKTYWHYHPSKSDWTKFEEIYEVLSWSAIYLQQNNDEVKFTDAFTWDKVVMNEWFGHITINPSDEEILVMANIVDDSFSSEYWEYKELNWWNFYYTTNWWKKNPNYSNDLKINESEELFEWWDMYDQFLDDPERFIFLH
jgi:glucose-6-phosphate isomerase